MTWEKKSKNFNYEIPLYITYIYVVNIIKNIYLSLLIKCLNQTGECGTR